MNYYNLFEICPEDRHSHIANMIWEEFDKANIKLNQDAELSIRVYYDNQKTVTTAIDQCSNQQ